MKELKPVVTISDVIVYILKTLIVAVLAFGVYFIGLEFKLIRIEQEEAVYQEVYYMNNDEAHQFVFELLGVDSVHYYDWEETAASLDIPIDSLTTKIYMQHLLGVY
jgi:hypothetical protein